MTRLWYGVDVEELCDDHLLGEHSEMHQEVGTWHRHPHGKAVVEGHVEKAQVVPTMIRGRHDELAAEMAERGFNHDSPLEEFDPDVMPDVPQERMNGIHEANRDRLARRCDDCL